MAKVIHIRDVPDSVHAALTQAAQSQGISLTRYVQRELKQVAEREHLVRHNVEVIRRTQEQVSGSIDRETILKELHDGRTE
ncbi:FitA-like ribbon-helix-helix domain-containing protein [Arthrobacter sp.]|uniref:FitA-like ribbon-helix-helix domain-containing protein n=1 Tax=Arthrobacter sp. TaxID=1667 RepID=UPI003A90EF48